MPTAPVAAGHRCSRPTSSDHDPRSRVGGLSGQIPKPADGSAEWSGYTGSLRPQRGGVTFDDDAPVGVRMDRMRISGAGHDKEE